MNIEGCKLVERITIRRERIILLEYFTIFKDKIKSEKFSLQGFRSLVYKKIAVEGELKLNKGRIYNIKYGLSKLTNLVFRKQDLFFKAYQQWLIPSKQEKKKELMNKVGKAFKFLNKLALNQYWRRGFVMLLRNADVKKYQQTIKVREHLAMRNCKIIHKIWEKL